MKKAFKNILFVTLLLASSLALIIYSAKAIPNPGHAWTDIENGFWQASSTQTQLRSFTFPDLDTEILGSSSSITFAQQTITVSTTLSTTTDEIVYVDASTSAITVTLPSASGTNAGLVYVVKKIDASFTNIVTINPQANQTIGEVSSISFANRGEGAMLGSDGTNWQVIMRRDYDLDAFHTRGTSSNQWYTNIGAGQALATGALTANRIYAIPIVLAKVSTIDQIAINVTTGAASSNAQIGIYNDNGNEYPGTLAVDCGSIATASTGVVVTSTTNLPITLDAGLYWLVVDDSGTPTLRTLAAGSAIPLLGYASSLPTNAQFGWFAAFTKGALPATFPAGGSAITGSPDPAIFVRFSQ